MINHHIASQQVHEINAKNSNFEAMNLSFYTVFSILFGFFSTLLISINAEESEPMPLPTVAYGKIIRFTDFPSKFVKSRTIDVLLPNGYTPKQSYPVVYMHDGQMLFDDTHTWNHQEWGIDEVLHDFNDSLRPAIIVGIWNVDSLRRAEYFPEKALQFLPEHIRSTFIEKELHGNPLADEYLQFLTGELKPFIENMFSASTLPKDNFLMGSSMGGLISLYALCEYPQYFGGIAGLSTHWPGSLIVKDSTIPLSILTYMDTQLPPSFANKRLYIDTGTEGLDASYLPYLERMNAICSKHGYSESTYTALIDEGADHNEVAWRSRLHIPLTFLLRQSSLAD
jgi:enterochelin esterase-like enzyme